MAPHCFFTFSLIFFCFVTVQSQVFKLNGQQIQLDPGVTEPPDKILWTHNGNKLMEFNGTVEKVFGSYVGRVTLNRLTAQLQISDLRFEDSGKYECVIQLQGKTPPSSHKLVVIEKVAKPTITCEISPDSSLSAVLHCNEDLNQIPAPLEFMWISEGKLHPGTRLTISLGGELDEQQYTCQLSNPLSGENATFIAKDCYKVPDAGLSGGLTAAIITFTVITVCVVIILFALKHQRSKKKKEKARRLEMESRQADPNETDALIESDVLDHKEKYKMDYERRGLALIFNQERFNWQIFLTDRHGSNLDCANLKTSLEELNFEVRIYKDFKRKDVLRQVQEAAKEDHSDVDCFLLVFLSHGDDGKVYAYDGTIHTEEIVEQFKGDKCTSLVGKPKIFIFQADRGHMVDVPVMGGGAVDSEQTTNEVVEDASFVQTLPAGADIIQCYASPEGYSSFRNKVRGTWYIQSLCELLKKYGDAVEFTDLLTLVNRKVSMMNTGNIGHPVLSGKKQIPCFTSMLTKELYFHPKTLQDPQQSVLVLSDCP